MTSLSSSIPGSPSSPPQCSQTPSALPPTSSNHESTCGFGSGSVAPVAPPSQTFPTFLRRTPERDRERDRREMGLDLHQRHLSQCAEAGAVTQTGQTPAQAWSPTTSVTPRHLYLARGHQIQQRLSHPPTVSPTNDYSYNGEFLVDDNNRHNKNNKYCSGILLDLRIYTGCTHTHHTSI